MCPSTSKRKESDTALKRFEEKYLTVDDRSNPYYMYVPNKKDTAALRKLMDSRNYIRIMTQLDKNQYIVAQYYIYSEGDIWMCGDSLTLNQNPDKKIWCECLCITRKDKCLCYEEATHEFLSVCPECKKLAVFCKDTPFKCKHCDYELSYKLVNDLPFAKIPCQYCPREIGWEKAQLIRELVYKHLVNRSHIVVKKQEEEMAKLLEEDDE